MDPERIHAYLQAACAGLGFDIGEVWFSSSENGASTVAKIESRALTPNQRNNVLQRKQRDIKFLQLYTSKSYTNRRNDLLRPAGDGSEKNADREDQEEITKHVLSPKLVNAIANSAQVVWANCQEREGLLGRSDMRLQTAVGMPVAMDGDGNMCVVVMFSPNNVQSNRDAVEYLKCLSEGASTSNIPCLLPVMDGGRKRLEYNPKQFSEWEEHEKNDENKPENGDNFESISNELFRIPMFEELDAVSETRRSEGSSLAGSEDAFDPETYALYSTIMENPENLMGAHDLPDETISAAAAITIPQETCRISNERRERLQEFTAAFLRMSMFHTGDFWLPSDGPNGVTFLHHEFSLSSDENDPSQNFFKSAASNIVITGWSGAVGRAYCSGSSVWSTNAENIVDKGRAEAFAIANIRTAFAVPIFSTGSVLPSCVLCFYASARIDCVPFVLKFVQHALRSLWHGLDSLEPHRSIGKSRWKEVGPADLGEMAADLELQKAFYKKKRPHEAISSNQDNTEARCYNPRDRSSSLALQLQSLPPVSGEHPVALNQNQNSFSGLSHRSSLMASAGPRHSQNGDQTKEVIQNHLQEAIRLAADAKPMSFYEGSATKKAHTLASYPQYSTSFVPQTIDQSKLPYATSSQTDTRNEAQNFMPDVQDFSGIITNGSIYNGALHQNKSVEPLYVPTEIRTQHRQQHQQQPELQSQTAFIPQPVMSQSDPFVSLALPPTTSSNSTVLDPNPVIPLQSPFCLPVAKPPNTTSGRRKAKKERAVCRIQGCEQLSASRKPYCTKHSGNRICEHPDCTKCAQGATRFCISHGGGRRCTFPGCDKGARDKFFCAAHGGGKRCKFEGCKKSAVGGSNLCTSHGGGRRCAMEGCEKSAQSSTKFCVRHGGGKKCAHADCEKVARGKTLYCASHGGGVRCKLEGCTRIAIGKKQLCRAHGGGSQKK